MMAPRALFGPVVLVLVPGVVAATVHSRLAAVLFLLVPLAYAINWFLLCPRHVTADRKGITVVYGFRLVHFAGRTLIGARVVEENDVAPYWGIMLPYRLGARVKIDRGGAVRLIATARTSKYALVLLADALPLLIGCELPSDLVGAVRSIVSATDARRPGDQAPDEMPDPADR